MQQKPTELHLNNAEYVTVYVNGKVVGECTLGRWEGADDLMERVRHARRLEAVPWFIAGLLDRLRTIPNIEDHINATPAAKQQAFARGLMDALGGKTVPHPAAPGIVPDLEPEGSRAYGVGYDYGRNLAMVAKFVGDANASPSPAPSPSPAEAK